MREESWQIITPASSSLNCSVGQFCGMFYTSGFQTLVCIRITQKACMTSIAEAHDRAPGVETQDFAFLISSQMMPRVWSWNYPLRSSSSGRLQWNGRLYCPQRPPWSLVHTSLAASLSNLIFSPLHLDYLGITSQINSLHSSFCLGVCFWQNTSRRPWLLIWSLNYITRIYSFN